MTTEFVTGGDSQKIIDLMGSTNDIVFGVDSTFEYELSEPIRISRIGIKRAYFEGAKLNAWANPEGAFIYEGHPQGREGKGMLHMSGARIYGASGNHDAIGLDLRHPNFITIEDFEFHNIRTAFRQRNAEPDSWSEHNVYRDFRMVNCATGWLLDVDKGNPSMRGTIIGGNNTVFGSVRPFVATGVHLYSCPEIHISMWAKGNTGTASMCLENTGIRGSKITLNHENEAELGIFLDGDDAGEGHITAHFAHDVHIPGMLTRGTDAPVTRFTYDPGVKSKPREWITI